MRSLVTASMTTVLGLLALTACVPAEQSAASELPDCSASGCEAELADYRAALEGAPGIAEVTNVRYVAKQITAGPHVSGDLVLPKGVPATDCAELEAIIGQRLWESSVSPASYATFSCYQPGAAASDYEYASFSLDDQDGELTEAWGPRGGATE